MVDDPPRLTGFCPHGKVRTLCPECRAALPTAAPAPVRRAPSSRPLPVREAPISSAETRMLRAPVARGQCATCRTEGTARELVQDIEYRQFLCREHARTLAFERVLYDRDGRQVELVNPQPEAWGALLADPSAAAIRVYRGRARPTRPPS